MSKEWYLNNPPPDYIVITKDRRSACGLPIEVPIYDVVEDGILCNKRVPLYKDTILRLDNDANVIREYVSTNELDRDTYSYSVIREAINKKQYIYGSWWVYKSAYNKMTGLQRLMYIRL